MTQGQLGAKAFSTSYESGRAKIRNIELGKQVPTADDLVKIARALDVDASELEPGMEGSVERADRNSGGVDIDHRVLELFPGLEDYLPMLNKAAVLGDGELIRYIAGRIATLLALETEKDAASGEPS